MRSSREATSRLRRRKRPIEDAPSSSSKERIFELSPSSTMAAVFFLLVVGGTLATAYIVVNGSNSFMLGGYRAALMASDNSQQQQAQQQYPATNDGTNSDSSSQVRGRPMLATPIVATSDNFPIACTEYQMDIIKQQLKPEGCFEGRPWSMTCSISQATIGCQDHAWMTEVYAHQSFTDDAPFVAIVVGWPKGFDTADFFMVDLQLGTKNSTRFDPTEMLTNYGGDIPDGPCVRRKLTFSGTASSNTKVYVLVSEVHKHSDLLHIQKEYDADHILIIEDKSTKTAAESLDAWVQEQLPSTTAHGDDPIHHLSINVEGRDFGILMGSSNMLNRVRYLDFEVHWRADWSKGSLSVLIRKLKTRGFVCYFSGPNANLWRITDCWMMHYGEKYRGRVACVNAHHADVKGILELMENVFVDTLTKKLSYG